MKQIKFKLNTSSNMEISNVHKVYIPHEHKIVKEIVFIHIYLHENQASIHLINFLNKTNNEALILN